MIKTAFYLDKVRQMRVAACMSLNEGLFADHKLHTKLFAEELFEFLTGIAEKSQQDTADALGDILVVACGYVLDAREHAEIDIEEVVRMATKAAQGFDINLPGAFMLIHDSNMSKLCTYEQREPTRLKYAERGIEVEFRDTGTGLWSAFAANSADGIPKGKWLKGVGYHEPAWDRTGVWQAA